MRFVPATEALLRQFYGEEVPPFTLRAYVVLDDDGVPKAIGGFIRIRGNNMIVFSDHAEEDAKAHKITALKFAKMLMQIADKNGWVLHAEPAMLESAVPLLEHLGFERGKDGYYVRRK